MDNCNGLKTTTKVEAPLGIDENGSEAERYLPNSYASVIGMMPYPESNKRSYKSFYAHQCFRFTHNIRASHETDVRRTCQYLQGAKYKGLIFNAYNKLVVYCYADADFAGLWGHENIQDPICVKIRTRFVVTFSCWFLLWVSKLQTQIALSNIHSEYVDFSCSVRELLPLKSLTKEVIGTLVIDNENLNFVSRPTVYEENNVAIVVETSTKIDPTSNHISVKYHWFSPKCIHYGPKGDILDYWVMIIFWFIMLLNSIKG